MKLISMSDYVIQQSEIQDQCGEIFDLETDGKPPVIGCFSLEREELNPFVKPSNKHGNNGYNTYQSGRKPSRWKEVKFIEKVTQDFAVNMWSGYANENGWRIVNWNNGEIVAGGRSRF